MKYLTLLNILYISVLLLISAEAFQVRSPLRSSALVVRKSQMVKVFDAEIKGL